MKLKRLVHLSVLFRWDNRLMGSFSQSYGDKISSTVISLNSVVVRNIFSTRRDFASIRKDVLPTNQQCSVFYRLKCRCEADYMGRTIQQLELRLAKHVLGFIRRHDSLVSRDSQKHESAIGEHLLSSVTCGFSYSADFFSGRQRARPKHFGGDCYQHVSSDIGLGRWS